MLKKKLGLMLKCSLYSFTQSSSSSKISDLIGFSLALFLSMFSSIMHLSAYTFVAIGPSFFKKLACVSVHYLSIPSALLCASVSADPNRCHSHLLESGETPSQPETFTTTDKYSIPVILCTYHLGKAMLPNYSSTLKNPCGRQHRNPPLELLYLRIHF